MMKLTTILLLISLSCFSQQAVKLNGVGTPLRLNGAGKPVRLIPPINRTVGEFGNVVGEYNAFGNTVVISKDRAIHCFRAGNDHFLDGNVDLIDLDINGRTWSNRRTIYTRTGNNDVRDPRIMKIRDTLFVFFNYSDETDRETLFSGYIKATDGLIGATWSELFPLPLEYNSTYPWGDGFEGFSPGEYFHPYYSTEVTDIAAPDTIFKIGLHRTTDYGATWSQITVYEGTEFHAVEPAITKAGSAIVCIVRLDPAWGETGGLGQSISTDGGSTWSPMAYTNIGGTEANIPCLTYYNGNLMCLYQDRNASGYMKISITPAATVIANPLAWNTPVNYFQNTGVGGGKAATGLGYPDIQYMEFGRFLVTWGTESSGDAFMKWRFEDFLLYD